MRIGGAPRRVDLGVLVAAALLLGGGAAYASTTAPAARAETALGGEVALVLPRGWVGAEVDGVYTAQRPSLDGIAPTLEIQRLRAGEEPPAEGESLMAAALGEHAHVEESSPDLAVARMHEARRAAGVGYRVLSAEDRAGFGGHRSWLHHYAIVEDPPDAAPGAAVLPIVVEGWDALVIVEAGHRYRVSLRADAAYVAARRAEMESLLASVQVSP